MYLQIPDLGNPAIRIIPVRLEHCLRVMVVDRRLYSMVFQIVVVRAVKVSDLESLLRLIA
jgi:hypothetical protein